MTLCVNLVSYVDYPITQKFNILNYLPIDKYLDKTKIMVITLNTFANTSPYMNL